MIQYYLDLERQVKKVKDEQLSYGQIQKIYSTAFFISISIRTPGKTWYIYLGRGSGQEGLWIHERPPVKELRQKDHFLEYLRKHVSSCSLIDVEIDSRDRIIALHYQKFGQRHAILFFWKARKLYFLHHYQDQPDAPFKVLLSWRGKAFLADNSAQNLFEYFDEVGRSTDLDRDLESTDHQTIDQLLANELRLSTLNEMKVNPGFLERKRQNIEEDLRKAQQWQKLQSILDKDEKLDNLYILKVDDQNVKFEGELNPYERRDLVFQKIKKLKRGEDILSKRLSIVNEQLLGVKEHSQKKSIIPIIKPVWGKEELVKQIISPSKDHEDFKVFSYERFQIAVGLSATGNDQLRNRWANKEDMWLHLDTQKSSHVVIKSIDNTAPGPEVLNVGASILASFSRFESDWIPIIFTQVKNLKGVTGAAGMVTYKKEKHLRCPRVSVEQLLKG